MPRSRVRAEPTCPGERPEDVRSAAEGMCGIPDRRPPVWCHGDEVTAGCALISMPIRGQQVAELVSRLTETEKP